MKPSRQEIQKIWSSFLVGPDDPLSLRFLCPKGVEYKLRPLNITFNSRDFPDVQERKRAFEEEALRRNLEGYNVYHLMNVIDPAFKGDLHNGLPFPTNPKSLKISVGRWGPIMSGAEAKALDALMISFAKYIVANHDWDQPYRPD